MEPDIQHKVNYAIEKWKLDHLEALCEHPAKAVFSAESEQFGNVILKIDPDRRQLESEYRMLARLSGRCSCKAYAYDRENGLLLEERIFPGTTLRREASLGKRVQSFLRVFREIHMPADAGETYLDWLERICEYCAWHGVAEDMASHARLFCAEMFEKYPDRVLLHGDLHHDNLLLREVMNDQRFPGTDVNYAMIDPKGVVGPAIMDLPRFVLNELNTEHGCPDRQHMEEVIRLLAEQSGYPAADIGKLFYMEAVLANVWRMEDGEEINRRELELADSLAGQGILCNDGNKYRTD